MDLITIDMLLMTFFVCIIADFVTGVIASAKEGKLKSRVCSNGMFRSIGECVVLVGFAYITYYLQPLVDIAITFIIGFIFKEVLSICENLKRLDVWIPSKLSDTLEVEVNKVNKNGGDKNE